MVEKFNKKEWNGGAIVSLIYIIIYGIMLITNSQLPSGINSGTFGFQFLLGFLGMLFAFQNFRKKNYKKGALFYFLSLIPSWIWVQDGLVVSIVSSIFVISTLIKKDKIKI